MNCKNSLHLLSIPQHRYTESNPRYPDPPGEPNALTRNAKRLRARETSTLPNLQNKTALRWRLPGPVSKARASLAEPASVGRLHTQLSSTPWEKMRRAAQPDPAVTPESITPKESCLQAPSTRHNLMDSEASVCPSGHISGPYLLHTLSVLSELNISTWEALSGGKKSERVSHSVVPDSLRPHGL